MGKDKFDKEFEKRDRKSGDREESNKEDAARRVIEEIKKGDLSEAQRILDNETTRPKDKK